MICTTIICVSINTKHKYWYVRTVQYLVLPVTLQATEIKLTVEDKDNNGYEAMVVSL